MELDDWELNKFKLYLHPRSVLLAPLRSSSMHRLPICRNFKKMFNRSCKEIPLFSRLRIVSVTSFGNKGLGNQVSCTQLSEVRPQCITAFGSQEWWSHVPARWRHLPCTSHAHRQMARKIIHFAFTTRPAYECITFANIFRQLSYYLNNMVHLLSIASFLWYFRSGNRFCLHFQTIFQVTLVPIRCLTTCISIQTV